MKICLYSPYIPQHTGGGEKYFLDVARLLAEKHTVFVVVPGMKRNASQTIKEKYERFLGASLGKVTFIDGPLGLNSSMFKKIWWTRQFDVFYYLTDGSFFFSLAKKNITHIQIPFSDFKNSWLERRKLANWEIKNTNSQFTKSVIERNWRTKIQVVHWPMIEVPTKFQTIDFDSKEPIILHVGRFFTHQHSKRQDVLIDFFKNLVDQRPRTLKNWQLILLGTIEDEEYVTRLVEAAKGYPIKFVHTATRDEVWQYYQRASIYWHATGFDADETAEPEKVEHFGISTVEAMALGCAPVVIRKGGQPEVLGPALAEWSWLTEAECSAKTLTLIEQPTVRQRVQLLAHKQSRIFSQEKFVTSLEAMIGEKV